MRSSQNAPHATFTKFTNLEGKRCMLALPKLDVDFSRGCALPVITHSFLATHPHPLLHELTLGGKL
jgi:hypothetical protein